MEPQPARDPLVVPSTALDSHSLVSAECNQNCNNSISMFEDLPELANASGKRNITDLGVAAVTLFL